MFGKQGNEPSAPDSHRIQRLDSKIIVQQPLYTSKRKAIQVGQMLEDNEVCHFEDPCSYWELERAAEVVAALNLDVADSE